MNPQLTDSLAEHKCHKVGEYWLRGRTIDENGIAQPMPRPFRKSGRAAIGQMSLTVEA